MNIRRLHETNHVLTKIRGKSSSAGFGVGKQQGGNSGLLYLDPRRVT